MTRVYGGCIEPGGMEPEDETEEVACPRCGELAIRRRVELCEGGSINRYEFSRCYACGHLEGDVPDQWADQWFDPEDPRFAVPPDDDETEPADGAAAARADARRSRRS